MRVRQFIVVVIIGSMKGQMHIQIRDSLVRINMGPDYACMPCKQ